MQIFEISQSYKLADGILPGFRFSLGSLDFYIHHKTLQQDVATVQLV